MTSVSNRMTLSNEHSGGAAEVDLDAGRPLDAAHVRQIAALVATVREQPGAIPVIRVSGSPATPVAETTNIRLINKWEKTLRDLERLPAPVLVGVEGECGGVGFELLLCADRRLGHPELSLRLPRTSAGVWPGMFLYRLAHQVGFGRARRLLFGTSVLDCRAAMELDLVDDVVTDLRAGLEVALDELRGMDAVEVGIRRQLLFDATTTRFEVALGRHLAASERALRHHNDRVFR